SLPGEDPRMLAAKSSAEAAARLSVGQLGQLNAVDVGEKPARFSLYTELTQSGAGIVISDAGAIAGGNRQAVELQDMREKTHQLVGARGQGRGPRCVNCIVLQQVRVVPRDHPGAGAGGHHDMGEALESID